MTGSDSQRASELISDKFDSSSTESDLVVFDSDSLTVDDPAYRSAVEAALNAVRSGDHVLNVTSPYAEGAEQQIAGDRRTAFAAVGMDGSDSELQSQATTFQERVASAVQNHEIDAYFTGYAPISAASVAQGNEDLARAESIGLPLALLVLLVAFGTLVAAGLPLLLGIFGVVLAFGALGVASFFTDFDVFVQSVVSMVGIALGIDYSLFIVTRYREERTRSDGSRADDVAAIGRTMATAGKAVLFSGSTVLISLAGLLIVRAPVVQTMAAGMMAAVAVMVVVTLTLLPALLGLLRGRINKFAVPGLRGKVEHPDPQRSAWARWTRLVMRRPLMLGGLAAVVMVTALVPAFGIRFGVDLGVGAVADTPAGRGYELVSQRFAPGVITPVNVVVNSKDGSFDKADLNAVAGLTADLRDDARTEQAVSMTSVLDQRVGSHSPTALERFLESDNAQDLGELVNAQGNTGVIVVYPSVRAESDEAHDLVHTIRDSMAPSALSGGEGDSSSLEVYVGGSTAEIVDISAENARATPLVILFVLGASFLLLLLAFRSVLLPLKAIVMNLLSVGAAFGLLVLVFQEGVGASLIGAEEAGFIQVILPLFAFAILFGLSMDYEVFLVSRMKEEWAATGDNRAAVSAGITHTAGVITAAASIMVVVFASFMFTDVLENKQMGFALAVAVLLDATLLRLFLVPAVMRLLGPANWWLPRWLDRILPRVDLGDGR
ncbi:MMPL family transporter [Streptomyces oceani]|uniref:MMPL family transporter n=1 Tax=Streptomyces oceani TaxID=1075402 RepID=UPI00147A2570|nr:MMPL family transporter [Streptomyces oceani]